MAKKLRKSAAADKAEQKGDRTAVDVNTALDALAEDQERKRQRTRQKKASDKAAIRDGKKNMHQSTLAGPSTSKKARKADSAASSLSKQSVISFGKDEEESDEEESDEEALSGAVVATDDEIREVLKGDLCGTTKAALDIFLNNPVLSSMFKVDPKAVAKAVQSGQNQAAIDNAFTPIEARSSTALVPYDSPEMKKRRGEYFWFMNEGKTWQVFVKLMRAYRETIDHKVQEYLTSQTKESQLTELQESIFDALPKGTHDFPERAKQAWMDWSLSGVNSLSVHCDIHYIMAGQAQAVCDSK
jgi:hypothetical protein